MALNVPLLSRLVLPHPIYEEFELDPRDSFFDTPRGAQKAPTEAFFTKHGSKEEDGAKKHTVSQWTNEILIRGLNVTIRQFIAADLALKEELLNPKLKMWTLRNMDSPKNKHFLWSVRTRLLQKFICLRPIFNDAAYGWWANDAYDAWVCASIRWIKSHPELIGVSPRSPKSVPRPHNISRPKAFLLPSSDVAYPLKCCFLKFGLPNNSYKTVPFTAIMTLKSAGDLDLDVSTTDINALYTSAHTEFDVCNPRTEIIKYDIHSSIGSMEGEVIENSKDLRKAILDLYKKGQRIFDLRVESRVKQEIDDDLEVVVPKKREAPDGGERKDVKKQRRT